MRILIVAIGSTGDVQPMTVLGKELAQRGYTVSIAAFSALQPMVERAGLSFLMLPGDAERYIGTLIKPGANPYTFLSRLMGALDHVTAQLFDTILQACKQADAVIGTYFGNTLSTIASNLGIPFVEVCYCPMYATGDNCLPVIPALPFGRVYNKATYRLADALIQKAEKRYTYALLAQNGMQPRYTGEDPHPVLNAYSAHISPRSPEWPPNVHLTGFLHAAHAQYTPTPSLAAFLDAGEPPLYIGFGSMTSGDAQKTVQAVLYALERLRMRAILSSGWSHLQPEKLPGHIYLLTDYAPHDWLFEQVKAVVHHGGAGTTFAGLYAGAPSLLIPFGSDQYFWGMRVHRLGCGPKPLSYTKMNGRKLAQRLEELTQPIYRERAQTLRHSLRLENGVQTAADIIQSHLLKNAL